MILTPINFDLNQIDVSIDGLEPRSPGLHLSQIIKAIEMRHGRLKGRTDIGDGDDDKWKDYRTAGFLIERVVRDVLCKSNRLTKVGEQFMDGVYITPDFVDVDGWIPTEIKCTWRSMRTGLDDPEFDSWWWQLKAQCRALSSNRGRLLAFFVNGDYKPRKPVFTGMEAEFSDVELEENWQFLTGFARGEGWL